MKIYVLYHDCSPIKKSTEEELIQELNHCAVRDPKAALAAGGKYQQSKRS